MLHAARAESIFKDSVEPTREAAAVLAVAFAQRRRTKTRPDVDTRPTGPLADATARCERGPWDERKDQTALVLHRGGRPPSRDRPTGIDRETEPRLRVETHTSGRAPWSPRCARCAPAAADATVQNDSPLPRARPRPHCPDTTQSTIALGAFPLRRLGACPRSGQRATRGGSRSRRARCGARVGCGGRAS